MKPRISVAVALLAVTLASIRLWAAANGCRYTIGTDTVVDNVTGLVWQRATQGPNLWSSAVSSCQSLNLGGYSSGWRLPTIHELETLVDNRGSSAKIDLTAFPDTTGQGYWSSTGKVGSAVVKWHVDFGYGASRLQGTEFQDYWRCVR